ncbi:hypothetical protein KKF84_03850, partial [Myxococcota bacterium]|nr:hypothetical protein [Myxococcota bacterium]MBU1534427.1 hypothetical protein [Myxococcota bacterium]
GNTSVTWNSNVIGFRYYSSQGSSTPGSGGMGWRNAIFSDYGCPSFTGVSSDCNVIYSLNTDYLNTGVVYHPSHWRQAYYAWLAMKKSGGPQVSFFDGEYFNGVTDSVWVPSK